MNLKRKPLVAIFSLGVIGTLGLSSMAQAETTGERGFKIEAAYSAEPDIRWTAGMYNDLAPVDPGVDEPVDPGEGGSDPEEPTTPPSPAETGVFKFTLDLDAPGCTPKAINYFQGATNDSTLTDPNGDPIEFPTVPTLSGEYTFTGVFSSFRSRYNNCITSVNEWEDTGATSVTFLNNSNLTHVSEPPSSVVNMEDMFFNALAFNDPEVSDWDVSHVTNMNRMFGGNLLQKVIFNQDLSEWDVSNVTTMSGMFDGNLVFNNPLNGWDVSSVKNMSKMFNKTTKFDQDLSSWDVSNVTNFSGLFADSAMSHDVGMWDTSSATDLSRMFYKAPFDHPVNDWDVSNVTNMSEMFALTPFDQPLDKWDVSQVKDMSWMFKGGLFGGKQFNQDISMWETSSLQNTNGMFQGNRSYNQPMNDWDMSNVTSTGSFEALCSIENDYSTCRAYAISGMFQGATAFNQPLDKWDTSSFTDVSSMFEGTRAFNQDLSSWDLSHVNNANRMFLDSNFRSKLPANGIGTNATNVSLHSMFAYSEFNGDVSSWDMSNVSNTRDMFRQAFSFSGDLSSWDTSNVRLMAGMFRGIELSSDISGWDLSSFDEVIYPEFKDQFAKPETSNPDYYPAFPTS